MCGVASNAMQPNLITMQLELGLKLALQVPYHQHVMLNRAPTKYICIYIYECAPVHVHAQIKRVSDVKVDPIVKSIWSKA